MNRSQFHQYLSFPDQLNAESLGELDNLVKEYPYFQAARMLLVKNLKNEENIRFNRQLKFAAACINNRHLLFGLLNKIRIADDGSFIPDLIQEPSNPNIGDIKSGAMEEGDGTQVSEEIFSLDEGESGKTDTVQQTEVPGYDKSIYVKELERFIPVADLDLLLFDFTVADSEILNFDFEDKHPEIRPEASYKDDAKVEEKTSTVRVSPRDLIDDFIRNSPRMPQPSDSGQGAEDISLDSLKESDAFMTETLAEIYMKQGYYYRALQAYEKLSLKYPQKSTYFASQIQKIKELITNQ